MFFLVILLIPHILLDLPPKLKIIVAYSRHLAGQFLIIIPIRISLPKAQPPFTLTILHLLLHRLSQVVLAHSRVLQLLLTMNQLFDVSIFLKFEIDFGHDLGQ
jgi:hypothetical protein